MSEPSTKAEMSGPCEKIEDFLPAARSAAEASRRCQASLMAMRNSSANQRGPGRCRACGDGRPPEGAPASLPSSSSLPSTPLELNEPRSGAAAGSKDLPSGAAPPATSFTRKRPPGSLAPSSMRTFLLREASSGSPPAPKPPDWLRRARSDSSPAALAAALRFSFSAASSAAALAAAAAASASAAAAAAFAFAASSSGRSSPA
mmetsp:Transcript_69938/g.149725  ORF Transcript_69938/g.149725 Transcript_69938/m.149725 type:complete len:203 (-) Transcript_69938:1224-1832(-)